MPTSPNLLWLSYRRYLARNSWLFFLSISAVALGVAVILAIDIASVSARKSFELSLEALTGRSNYAVVGAGSPIDEDFYRTLRVDWGVRDSAPIVEGYLSFPDPLHPDDPGAAIPLTLLGVDPLADDSIRTWTAGTVETSSESGGLTDLIGAGNRVVATRETAQKLGWELGRPREVWVGSTKTSLVLAGVFQTTDEKSAAALDNVLLTDISVAQQVFQRFGFLDRIDILLPEDSVEALRGRLPKGLVLQESGQSRRTASELSSAFHINLKALSYLCLLVGTFLIYNVVSFTVSHRREALGRLRVIGVTSRELGKLLLSEALALGLVGSLIGVLLGIGLGRTLVPLVTRTINDLYYVHAITRFSIDPWLVAKAFLGGILATGLAALIPALQAAGTSPLELMHRVEPGPSRISRTRKALFAGLACLATAGLILLHQSLTAGLFSLLLLIVGYSLTVPTWLVLFCRLAGRFPGNVAQKMAVRGVGAFLGRTALATAALTVAVAATISIAMMVSSFRGSLMTWLETTLTADIYISLKDRAGLNSGGALKAENVEQAVGLSFVSGWTAQRLQRLPSSTGETFLVGVKVGGDYRESLLFLEAVPDAWRRFESGEGVFVTEPYARRAGLFVGSKLRVSAPLGDIDLPVLGVYYSYAPDRNLALLSSNRYQREYDDTKWSGLGLYLKPGTDPSLAQTELRRIFGSEVEVKATGEIKRLALSIFDRTFTVTEVLRFLALGVAFIGVFLSLLALSFERSQEIAVLRALGLSRKELFGLSLTQSLALGFLAGVLALPLGYLLSYEMVSIINRRAFGWTITFEPDWIRSLSAIVLALLSAVLAGLYPAWRWSREEDEMRRERE